MKIDAVLAIEALEEFRALALGGLVEDALAPLIKDFGAIVSSSLKKTSVDFRQRLSGLKSRYDDDRILTPADWAPYLSMAQSKTREKLQAGFFANVLEALTVGGGHLVDDINLPLSISFALDNRRALEYAILHSAKQISKIEQSTKDLVSTRIANAVSQGMSYSRLERELSSSFAFSKDRAHRIAVYEIGDAYEQGKYQAANQMEAAGLQMEKAWFTAEDSRVRPEHRQNQAAGYIPKDETFPGDGALAPPTDPGCRCTLLWRAANVPQMQAAPRRVFQNRSEIESWGKSFEDNRTEDFSDSQGKSLGLYKTSISSKVNDFLRHGKEERGFWNADKLREHVGNLDSAFDGAPKTIENIEAYRGVSTNLFRNAKPGEVFLDKGFVSTSLDSKMASGFPGQGSTGALLRINVPRGSTKAIYIDNYGLGANEYEFLLPRGSRFRYLGPSQIQVGRKQMTVIDVELLPHESRSDLAQQSEFGRVSQKVRFEKFFWDETDVVWVDR